MKYGMPEKAKKELNKVGPGFCLAKWTQSTIHLHLGKTHSCHHPEAHSIPLVELTRNPSALHNTRYKKALRRDMLNGLRPKECDYCWNVEDNSEFHSDRLFKSAEPWSWDDLDTIKNGDWRNNFNPRYLEVSFSNTCNCKCSYCGPSFSSPWAAEIKESGSYPTTTRYNGLNEVVDEVPYLKAFWDWWPDLYNSLHTFRITGGEPLLSKDTWEILDFIINTDTPNKELHLAINTNLNFPKKTIDNFIEKINRIALENRVKDFVIYTSVDGWGKQAEYGRHGLVFNRFWDNVNEIMDKCPTVTMGVMCTYNALSVPTFDKLIHGVHDLKIQYASPYRAWSTAAALDTSYLRWPLHQTVRILPQDLSSLVKEQADIASNMQDVIVIDGQVIYGYTQMEIPKIERIYDWMKSPQDEYQQMVNRHDFYTFITEHDKRRGTDFCKTFPEYEDFYNFCKTIKI